MNSLKNMVMAVGERLLLLMVKLLLPLTTQRAVLSRFIGDSVRVGPPSAVRLFLLRLRRRLPPPHAAVADGAAADDDGHDEEDGDEHRGDASAPAARLPRRCLPPGHVDGHVRVGALRHQLVLVRLVPAVCHAVAGAPPVDALMGEGAAELVLPAAGGLVGAVLAVLLAVAQQGGVNAVALAAAQELAVVRAVRAVDFVREV